MKAIVQNVYGSPDVLRLEDIDKPRVGDKDVLVRVHAAGVDSGVWHLMTGKPYLLRLFGFGVRTPKLRVRGRDLAGTVSAVGGNVTRFQPGDEVFGTSLSGTYADYAVAGEDRLELKPANLTFEEAAAVPVSAAAALHGLRDAGRIEEGQEVLIVGAGGGFGSFAVQFAKAYGANVTGVCSSSKVELVRSLGADHVIDYTKEDFADGGRRYDLILEIAGNNTPLSRLRKALTPKGTLVLAGGEGGGEIFGGVGRQLGGLLWSFFISQKIRALVSGESVKDLQDLREFIEAGKVTPAIGKTFSLIEVPEAIRQLRAGEAHGKLVVTLV